jgi:hypothetical protein
MKNALHRIGLFLVILACLVLHSSPVWAYGELYDDDSLRIKGFSWDMRDATGTMISRQEGRHPKKSPGKWKQVWFNFVNANWTDPIESFTFDLPDVPVLPWSAHDKQ